MKSIIALAIALSTTVAHAEFKDGNKLLSDMNSSSQIAQAVALGYVVGVADVFAGSIICAPQNVTAGQMHDLVKSYIESNPSVRHKTADVLTHDALKRVWPCKRGNGV